MIMSSEKHITDSTSQYTSRHCIITWAP